MAPTWRDLLVWLHVVTTVAWMSQALGLFALGLYSATTGDPRGYDMAEFLDESVLLHLAEAAFFTGLMLSALTRWGYFRYWWVLVKFAITLSQVHVAIFLLSPRLTARAEGAAEPDPFLLTGTLLMVSAIAFQAWLSVAKPWKRTPWAAPRITPPAPPAWFTAYVLAVPVLDYLLATLVFGHPAPLFFLVTSIGYPVWRARAMRRAATAPRTA